VTIAVSVKIHDEIVLVTDGASTGLGAMPGRPHPSFIGANDNANKGFSVAHRKGA